MERAQRTTRAWPMQLQGVLCVFGSWKADYATLEDGIFDPEVQIVWVFTEDDLVPPYEGRAQAYLNIDGTWPMEQVVAAILARVQGQAAFRGAISFSEEEIFLANMLNTHLSNGQPPDRAIRRQVDKAAFYSRLQEAGVPMVHFDRWNTWDELAALVAQGYQQGGYVLKPVNASESAGVYRSWPTENVEESFARFQSSCAQAARLGHRLLRPGQVYLIMEYIECGGEPIELTAEVLVRSGEVILLVVQEKMKTAAFAPFFDQQMVSPPVSPSIVRRLPEIREVTHRVVRALDIQQSVLHLEFRLTQRSCIPIDCAMRPGGGFIPHAVYQLSGVDLRLAHVASHLADHPEARSAPDGAGGTCIGALYTTLIPSLEVRTRLVKALEGHSAIFALAASEEFIAEPQFTADATLSLGVRARTPESALLLFNAFTALPAGESASRAAGAAGTGAGRGGSDA
jgi:ATP-grasp domain